jgi:hypothetical protein
VNPRQTLAVQPQTGYLCEGVASASLNSSRCVECETMDIGAADAAALCYAA